MTRDFYPNLTGHPVRAPLTPPFNFAWSANVTMTDLSVCNRRVLLQTGEARITESKSEPHCFAC